MIPYAGYDTTLAGGCDGERPDACTRCIARDSTCVYEPHTKTHKDDLLREIETMKAEQAGLQDQHLELQGINAGLEIDKKSLQHREHVQSVILDILTNNGHDREIIRRLRSGDSLESVAEWLVSQPELHKHIRTLPESRQDLVDIVRRVEDLYNAYDPTSPLAEPSYHWTHVTKSTVLVHHLFKLYFTWVHPVHMLFSEADFLTSFQNNNTVYCSSALVNAVCAMACHLLDNPLPSASSKDLAQRTSYQDAMKLRDGFMVEARSHLLPGSYSQMTTIQAFAVMFLVELSLGKARSATAYLRCAADHLRKRQTSEQSDDAVKLSYWGVHTLTTAWCGVTYQKPFSPESPKSDISFPDVFNGNEWQSYRQTRDEEGEPKRPGWGILTACYQAKLYRVVHDTINLYCGARGKATATAVVACFKRYMDWLEQLPPQFKSIGKDEEPLPHVLFLQYVFLKPSIVAFRLIACSIQYRTAFVQLIIPLLESDLFSPSDADQLRGMLVSYAREGLEMAKRSCQLYSSRYHMPLETFCIIHLTQAMLDYAVLDATVTQLSVDCLNVLQRTQDGFSLCGPLQQLFRQALADHEISVPSGIEHRLGSANRYGVDDILDACTRLSYTQPTDQILPFLQSTIATSWAQEWQIQIDQAGRGPSVSGRSAMPISSLINP
ncbi:MAG: hypothetical protein MMC33_003175 [Icmadophila ericetorum]|nr:hypothetical protein [Icmadophila ericetorum]